MKSQNKRPQVKLTGANTLNTVLLCHVELCETSCAKKIEILHVVYPEFVEGFRMTERDENPIS